MSAPLHGHQVGIEGPLLLKVPDVARLAGLGLTKTYQLISHGELPVVRLGRAVRVPRAALIAWIEARVEGGL